MGRQYYQVVQLLRSGILRDSKQLACVLLSAKGQCNLAAQMGIDMLNRLNCSTDVIESMDLARAPVVADQEITEHLSDALSRRLELGSAA